MKPEALAVPAASELSAASKYDRLIADARGVPPVPTIVAHPCDETSLAAPSRRAAKA
jgi:phosphate acetyltransferase